MMSAFLLQLVVCYTNNSKTTTNSVERQPGDCSLALDCFGASFLTWRVPNDHSPIDTRELGVREAKVILLGG